METWDRQCFKWVEVLADHVVGPETACAYRRTHWTPDSGCQAGLVGVSVMAGSGIDEACLDA
jgi:hypothetical protein